MTTTMNEKYNGWNNYETWNVALWLGNEQSTQEYWNDRAIEALDSNTYEQTGCFSQVEHATFALSEQMKEELDINMEDEIVEKLSGFYLDLLNGALREINWNEIAKHYIEAVIEEREYQKGK